MKSILILQNEIMDYRRPVYNGLAEHYDVVVLHSGRPSVKEGDRYREVITPRQRLWRFNLQHGSPLRTMIGDFDAVVAMFDLGWPTYLAPLFWRKRPKYILWGHGYGRGQVARAVRDRLIRRADRLLLYADEHVDLMVSRGVDRSKIAIAWNTMHVPNHHDTSSMLKNSFLFVGRLQERKRIDLAIEAFARLQGRIGDEIVLDIVGSGEPEDDLRQIAAEHNVSSKVVFHGRVDDSAALAELYSRAYAYVSPGPVGLGVLHSLAYGVPVITLGSGRHGPEFHNLVHGQNAVICGDGKEIERAMEQVCGDPSYLSELGRNAYWHYVQERPLSRMLEGFRKAIEE